MGYIGLILLVLFIFATLHAIGRVREFDPRRAWLLLSIALFVILTNFLEKSVWMRGTDILWLMFALVAAEAARYWHARRFAQLQDAYHGAIRQGMAMPARRGPVPG